MQEVERRFSVYAPGEDDIAATLRPRSRLPDWLDPDRGAFTVLGRADHGIHLFTRAISHSERARGRWRQGRLCAGIVPAGDHGCVLTVQVRHRGVVFAYREILLSLVGAQEEGEPICTDFQPRHLLTWTLLGDLSRIVTMRVAEMGTLAGALHRELRRQRAAAHLFSSAALVESLFRLNRRPLPYLGPEDCEFWVEAAPLRRVRSR